MIQSEADIVAGTVFTRDGRASFSVRGFVTTTSPTLWTLFLTRTSLQDFGWNDEIFICWVLQYWTKLSLRELPAILERIHLRGRVDPQLSEIKSPLDLELQNCHYWNSFVLHGSSGFDHGPHLSVPGSDTSTHGLLRGEEQFAEETLPALDSVQYQERSWRHISYCLWLQSHLEGISLSGSVCPDASELQKTANWQHSPCKYEHGKSCHYQVGLP